MSNLKKDLEDFKKTTEGFKKLKHPWAVKVLYPLFLIIIIIFIAILMKFIAASHFFWVGLSYDVSLNIWYYLFLMVFLGYLIILVGVIRITGGFTAGIIFVLQNFGISTEKALAMTLTLFMISKVSVIVFGICSAITMGLSIKSMKKIATKNMSM